MEEKVGLSVLEYLISKDAGLWAVMFVALLVTVVTLVRWVLKTNNTREERLIGVIDKQATALGSLDSKLDGVVGGIADIKAWMRPAYKHGNGEGG